MDDPSMEEKFSADIDRLLHGGEEVISAAGDHSQMVNTARELADLDLSPQSRIRASLRRRLLDELDARKARSMLKKKILPSWFSGRAVRLASVLLIVAGVAMLVGLSSGNTVQTVSGRISELIRIGIPTNAVQTFPDGLESDEPEGISQYPNMKETEETVAYWDMRWGYITLFGTMGGVQ
jgi:hypothetical protein